MAIDISVAADVTDVIRGTKNIGEALEDVANELDKLEEADTTKLERGLGDAADEAKALGKAGDKAGDQLEKGLEGAQDAAKDLGKAGDKAGEQLEDGLKGAGDGAERLEKKMREAFRDAGRDAQTTGKQIGDSQEDGLRRASEATDQLREDSFSNAKEVAASFDGSADSIAEGFQGAAAEALSGFGPLGAAAGLALAAGLGIAMAALNGEADRVNELGEEMSGLAGEIRETGGTLDGVDFDGRMVDWGLSIQDTRQWFEIFQKEAKTGLEVIEEKARDAGVTWETAFKGTKGSVEDSRKALEEVDVVLGQVRDSATVVGDIYSGAMMQDAGSAKQIKALEELKQGYEDNIVVLESAERQNQLLAEAGIQTADAEEKAAEAAERHTETLEAQQEGLERSIEVMERAQDAQRELAGANMSAVETEIAVIEATNKATETLEANGATLDLNTEAGRTNAGAVLDLVTAINNQAQAQVDAGASVEDATAKQRAQRDALVNQLIPAFGGSRDAAQAYIDKMLAIPKTVKTDVNLDGIPDAQQQLNNFTAQRPTIPVLVQASVDRQRAYNELYGAYGGHSFAVNITPRGGNQALP